MKKIRKVVIPAAGYGTRFLPATKAQPKEMLPIVDKPIIQYVVEDAVAAGIEDVIIVTGWQKRSIEDHFDYPFELEKRLEDSGKEAELEQVRKIAEMANFIYVRQKGPLGNATPVKCARHLLNDEPFLVLWGDDFIDAMPTRATQMVEAYEKYNGTILAAITTDKEADAKRYGFAKGEQVDQGVVKVSELIEKPGIDNRPSNLASVSGYVLTPEIWDILDNLDKGHGGELVLADAINTLCKIGKDVYATEITNGKYYDCGNKLEYIKAVVDFGLKHQDMSKDFRDYLELVLAGQSKND